MKGGNAGFALVGPIREGGRGVSEGAEVLRAAGGQSWEMPGVLPIAYTLCVVLLCAWSG